MDLPLGHDVWVELDSAGVVEILNSPEVQAAVHAEALRIQRAAKANSKGTAVTISDHQTGSGRRAVADIHGDAKLEAATGFLTRALYG